MTDMTDMTNLTATTKQADNFVKSFLINESVNANQWSTTKAANERLQAAWVGRPLVKWADSDGKLDHPPVPSDMSTILSVQDTYKIGTIVGVKRDPVTNNLTAITKITDDATYRELQSKPLAVSPATLTAEGSYQTKGIVTEIHNYIPLHLALVENGAYGEQASTVGTCTGTQDTCTSSLDHVHASAPPPPPTPPTPTPPTPPDDTSPSPSMQTYKGDNPKIKNMETDEEKTALLTRVKDLEVQLENATTTNKQLIASLKKPLIEEIVNMYAASDKTVTQQQHDYLNKLRYEDLQDMKSLFKPPVQQHHVSSFTTTNNNDDFDFKNAAAIDAINNVANNITNNAGYNAGYNAGAYDNRNDPNNPPVPIPVQPITTGATGTTKTASIGQETENKTDTQLLKELNYLE